MSPQSSDDYSDVAVVMITRNEERAIGKVVSDVLAELPGCRVYVVDGSTDSTQERARAAGATVVDEPPGGVGPALYTALTTPSEPIVASVDADDTYPIDMLPLMIRKVRDGADVVSGSRLSWTGTSNMPVSNWAANMAFNVLASAVARRRVKDVHSGMRVYRRDVLQGYDWRYQDLALSVDLLMYPVLSGRKVDEVAIPYRERVGESTLQKWPGTKATVWRLLSARKALRR